MKSTGNRWVFGAFLLGGIFGGVLLGAGEADITAEIQRQYGAMLAQMRKPEARGVLVTEVGPMSGAGRGGIKAGDIITEYGGTEIRTVDGLRSAVADALASREVSDNKGKLLLTVKRAGKTEVLQMPREPLGIRAIAVETGVAATMNPAPSQRGTVALTWDAEHFVSGDPQWYRLYEDGVFAGWQSVKWQAAAAGERSEVEMVTTRVEVELAEGGSEKGGKVRTLSKTVEKVGFRPGDYAASTPFQLDSLSLKDNSRGGEFRASGERTGGKLTGQIQEDTDAAIVERRVEMPLNTITPAGVRIVAAAMPQEKGHVLGFWMLTGWDLFPRPGYVLVTQGKVKMEGEGDGEGLFRVDLMQAGAAVETYWITPGRQVARVEMHAGSKREALRVGGEVDAKATTMPAVKGK